MTEAAVQSAEAGLRTANAGVQMVELDIRLLAIYVYGLLKSLSASQIGALLITLGVVGLTTLYLLLLAVAPVPRAPTPQEKTFRTVSAEGDTTEPEELPCWYDTWRRTGKLDEASIFMSVVVPAYNEDERMPGMLEEAVAYLEEEYGHHANGTNRTRKTGWEIIVVSDGSTDNTAATAISFARTHALSQHPSPAPGPRTPKPRDGTPIPAGSIRVVELQHNRGKGGAVTHGMRHVRGEYVVFADADGATRFSDLGSCVEGAEKTRQKDKEGRCVIVGSRAHLVGSEAVVKRSLLRNALMYAFHMFIRLLTTPITSRIGDTQCGFKLFTRSSLPYIVPWMHCEGWIFDVEMLMLTEAANIPMEEVPVGWKEVKGSKLNVIWDSLGMAWGLAVVRGAWSFGIWERK